MIRLSDGSTPANPLHSLAPDLTPMLDILFILIVFFLLTIGTVLPSLEVTLPESVAEQPVPLEESQPLLVEIQPKGYRLAGEEMTSLAQLQARLKAMPAEQRERPLVIAGEKTLPMQRLLEVLTRLQEQGLKTANILMQEAP